MVPLDLVATPMRPLRAGLVPAETARYARLERWNLTARRPPVQQSAWARLRRMLEFRTRVTGTVR